MKQCTWSIRHYVGQICMPSNKNSTLKTRSARDFWDDSSSKSRRLEVYIFDDGSIKLLKVSDRECDLNFLEHSTRKNGNFIKSKRLGIVNKIITIPFERCAWLSCGVLDSKKGYFILVIPISCIKNPAL